MVIRNQQWLSVGNRKCIHISCVKITCFFKPIQSNHPDVPPLKFCGSMAQVFPRCYSQTRVIIPIATAGLRLLNINICRWRHLSKWLILLFFFGRRSCYWGRAIKSSSLTLATKSYKSQKWPSECRLLKALYTVSICSNVCSTLCSATH